MTDMQILSEELKACKEARRVAVENMKEGLANYWMGRIDGLEMALTLAMAKELTNG